MITEDSGGDKMGFCCAQFLMGVMSIAEPHAMAEWARSTKARLLPSSPSPENPGKRNLSYMGKIRERRSVWCLEECAAQAVLELGELRGV